MTIALYVESLSETIGDNGEAGLDQTIIVPNYTIGAIQLFHRTSTGKRGRSEAWTLTPLSDLPNTRVIKNPVAIRLTDNDHFAIQGGKMYSALWDISQELRTLWKYEELSDEEWKMVERIRNKFYEILDDSQIKLDK